MSGRGRKLTDILHDNHTQLGQLLHKVFQLQDLESILKLYLDDSFVIHTKLGSYQNGKLTLLTESGNWATKLKYQVPDLIANLRKHQAWAGLRNIDIKVAPHLCAPNEPPPAAPVKPQRLSEQAQSTIKQNAKTLGQTQDSQILKEALLKLLKDK